MRTPYGDPEPQRNSTNIYNEKTEDYYMQKHLSSMLDPDL
jgi:hypothetical protein